MKDSRRAGKRDDLDGFEEIDVPEILKFHPAQNPPKPPTAANILVGLLVLVGLYLTTHVNYLLFHTLVELFSIVVASGLFMIAWNSRRYIQNSYLLFIGIAYLFIGFIDLLHTLSYKGMPIFTDYDFYANQLWIGARFMESISLVLGFAFLHSDRDIRPHRILFAYTGATVVLILSVFVWKVFPECFVEGVGLTPFKKVSEYVISGILLSAVFLLKKNEARFEPAVYRLILFSCLCTIVSELAFTFYVSNYGLSNLIGHYFKLFSFYLLYLAIIRTCIEDPYALIFRELDAANQKLKKEIATRIRTEKERESLIVELQSALQEIRTLQGILPICSHCKKIRDDQGYWNRIESYISRHSEAEFSHSICPECIKKYYPDLNIG